MGVKSRYWWEHHALTNIASSYPNQSKILSGLIRKRGWTFGGAIELEMKAIIDCAFEFRDDDKVPVGYHQHIDCHMIFDVKITFSRKARYVAGAGGHQTEPSKDIMFCKCYNTGQHSNCSYRGSAK
jgi:hypothetical protein